MRFPGVGAACLVVLGCSTKGQGAAPATDASAMDPVDASAESAVEAGPGAPADACAAPSQFDPAMASEIHVSGDAPAAGIFNPSIVYPADAAAGAMAYSAVPDQTTIRTHIAVSSDHGTTWTLAVQANAPAAATVASTNTTECPGGSCSGNLISEVPSLVLDADEPDAAKAWKLFSHRYLVGPTGTLHYELGTIALQTAPGPSGPWTAPEKLIGWSSSFSTYPSSGVVANVSTFASTADCLLLTEPGALWRPGAIDLAVGCGYSTGKTTTTRIELLRSTDHAATWQSVGTMVRPSDASCVVGAVAVNAADLFVSGGSEYLSATPGDSTGTYEGCLIFPIPDPTAGTLKRDPAGRAVVSRYIAPEPFQFSGACTFADGARGYSLDVGFLEATIERKFRIFTPGFAQP